MLEQSIDLEDRLPGGGPDFVSRFAALMHDVGKPRTRRFQDDGTVTFHHHDVVGAKLTRKRMKALRFSNDDDRRGGQAGRAAPALPRLRLRGVDRLGGAPLRPRRRRPAGPAARADPGRLHDPQPAQGRPAAPYLRRPRGADRPARRGGGAGRDPPGPRRQPDHGAARHRPGPRGRRGLPVPARAADGQRPDGRGRRERGPPHLVVHHPRPPLTPTRHSCSNSPGVSLHK